ncbi:hypothetical protein LAZ67_8001864 [Cordylochernes scorpioides]|uniref:Uncharacterized protein n=1 Tax=Cordylochernes scorpioides TaxID=51811 RepID=A0ABY6KQK6_9ARAC|nr:hypothetical protein LAZ67_8001864 [Cordylochernes scorpioides]
MSSSFLSPLNHIRVSSLKSLLMVSVLGMSRAHQWMSQYIYDVFFFVISTQSYQAIKLVELVDVYDVFFFLISTQSYQAIKLVELVDGVCAGDE